MAAAQVKSLALTNPLCFSRRHNDHGRGLMDRRSFLGAGFYAALLADAKAAGTSRAPKLKIRDVRAIRLKNGFNSRFVRVYTEEGLTGSGECVDSVGTEYMINNNFHTMLKG